MLLHLQVKLFGGEKQVKYKAMRVFFSFFFSHSLFTNKDVAEISASG